jgi:hypothetical protein
VLVGWLIGRKADGAFHIFDFDFSISFATHQRDRN